jgi:phosphonate metabolism-associated iron-containing alcohol dehydrogenase
MNSFYNPVAIYFGKETVEACAERLRKQYSSAGRVLILTRGGGAELSEQLTPLMNAFEGKETKVHAVSLNNPDVEDVYSLLTDVDGFDFHLIVAIGGGSVMDAAKVLAAMQHVAIESPADVRDYITSESYALKTAFAPWIGIPTTSGTGSEVTCWATVWDEERGCKYSVSDNRLYAGAALILPELTVTMPLRLSVATALDAMCHATEAYWSVHSNPISRAYALQAIERIREALPRLKDEPNDLDSREKLSLGSVLAGLAFSNTKTTACHSISYPLTLLHGIDHGIAASLSLAAVLKHNYATLIEPDKLLGAFGAKDADGVQRFLQSVYAAYGLSDSLKDYGVAEQDIETIVAHAYTKGRMDNNPAAITPEELNLMLVSLL